MSVVGYKARNHPQQVDKRGSHSAVDDRATPPEVFGLLNERFRFTIDVAASAALAPEPFPVAEQGMAAAHRRRGDRDARPGQPDRADVVAAAC